MEFTVIHPKIAIEVVESFEKKINRKLPKEYKEFLLKHNGGRVNEDSFDYNDRYGANGSTLHTIYGLLDENDSYDLDYNRRMYDGRILEGYLTIAEDCGGNLILLSLDDGKIYFWDYNLEDDPPSTNNMYLVKNSFNEFLDSLYKFELEG